MILKVRWKQQPLAEYSSPLQPVPRTAILLPGFRQTREVRIFAAGWDTNAARFRPAVIAAKHHGLAALALRFDAPVASPTHALVAFSFPDQEPLPERLRDLLWDRFGVPLFEQWLDSDCGLLASECAAHEGLHLRIPGIRQPGWNLTEELCACGVPGQVLRRQESRESLLIS